MSAQRPIGIGKAGLGAVLGKRKSPDAEEAVQVYQEILAQLRKASVVGKQEEGATAD